MRLSSKGRKCIVYSAAVCLAGGLFISARSPGEVSAAIAQPIAREAAGTSQPSRIDVTRYGIVPGRDVTAAFQQLINTTPEGATYVFPAGNFAFTRTVDIAKVLFQIEGAGVGAGTGAGTTLTANFAGPIIRYTGRKTFKLEGIEFRNKHAQGDGFETPACQMSEVNGCAFGCGGTGFLSNHSIGLGIIRTNFGKCGVGLANFGHVFIQNCNFTRNVEGARLSHMSAAIFETRWEVNGTALRLGIKPDGTNGVLSNFEMSAFTMEANDQTILVHNASGEIANGHIYGTGNAPSGSTKSGLDIKGGKLFLHNLGFSGGYGNGAIILRTNALKSQMKWQQVTARNMRSGGNDPDFAWMAEIAGQLVRLNPAKHCPNAVFEMTNWDEPDPIAVTLRTPLGTTTDLTPTFEWSPAKGARSYHIKCVERVLGRRPVVFSRKGIEGTSFTPHGVTLEVGKSYSWQVRALLADGSYSDWRAGRIVVSPVGPLGSDVSAKSPAGVLEVRKTGR